MGRSRAKLRPMRVLVATTAGAGHFGPVVPFASACRRAGHEVLVAAPRSFQPAVEAAGFRFWPCEDTPQEEWAAVMDRLPTLSYEEANALVVGDVFGRLDATAVLPGMLAAIDDWHPDVILREIAEYGSSVAAELRSIPSVRVAAGLGMTDALMTPIAAASLAPLRGSVGLSEDAAGEGIVGTPYFSLVPLSFEDPSSPGPAHALRFRDREPPEPAPLPAWWEGERAPLLYVTFGSVAASVPMFASVYRTVIDAIADLPVRILITVGRELDLGPVPANVRVETWVPQADVLGHAAAIVCHCGFGTMLGALAAGAPIVAVPLFADQPYNAQRVDGSGAGIAVDGAGSDAAALGDAVTRVLDDGSYRARAKEIAEDIRRLPPVDDAVAALRDIARA